MAETATSTMVPGGGIEPPTRGFSIPVQFNEINHMPCKRLVDRLGTKRDSVNGKWSHLSGWRC